MRSDASYMRGHDWEGEPVAGCYASRKLNGVACLWDGSQAWTRSGNLIDLPERITRTLPRMWLDCELIHGKGRNADFQAARTAVQFNRWEGVSAVAFDAPQAAGDWPARLQAAKAAGAPCVSVTVIQGNEDLAKLFEQISTQGGEGIMLRRPAKPYKAGRSRNVLKVLPSHHIYELICAGSAWELEAA